MEHIKNMDELLLNNILFKPKVDFGCLTITERDLKKFRLLKGFTQFELANRCEINRNYIGMLERGERNPTYFTLLSVVKGLEMELSDLIKG